MSVPRHFSQRPRRNLAPPPHPNQAAEAHEVVPEPVVVPVVVKVEPVAAKPEPKPVVEVVPEPKPVVEAVEADVFADILGASPKWDSSMKKGDLLKIATDMGLPVHESDTKAVILAALNGTLTKS